MTEQEFKDRWGFTVEQLGGAQQLPARLVEADPAAILVEAAVGQVLDCELV